jgi:hypothetical protein
MTQDNQDKAALILLRKRVSANFNDLKIKDLNDMVTFIEQIKGTWEAFRKKSPTEIYDLYKRAYIKYGKTPTTPAAVTTPDITISLPPLTNTSVPVFIFYPGIAVNNQIGKVYMPPLIQAAVPTWYNNYVIVIPNEHTTKWENVESQYLAKMKEKGLTVKSINLGIFSGSGNNNAPIMTSIGSLKLNTLTLMDPVPNALTSKMNSIKAKGTTVVLEYNPKNWQNNLAVGFPALALAVGSNVYNTNSVANDHIQMPNLTLTRYKTLIESKL